MHENLWPIFIAGKKVDRLEIGYTRIIDILQGP
jgi:hypothetical protein